MQSSAALSWNSLQPAFGLDDFLGPAPSWSPASWRRFREWFHAGGWPWFGPMDALDDVMPWGRSTLVTRPGSGSNFEPNDPVGGGSRKVDFYHLPVLLPEVVELLKPEAGKLIFDGTLGGGGHSEAMLQHGARVVAMDQDEEALRHARLRLGGYGDRFVSLHGNFRDMSQILAETGVSGFDAMLVDIGVSSRQLDDPTRGFSFQGDGPLDLRMDRSRALTAADLVQSAGVDELTRIFRDYGEEPSAWKIANAIVDARAVLPITTTARLVEVVEKASPRRGKRHPATLVFQALRIAVNDELGALEDFLAEAPKWLKPGGRLGIISFHSLEDRLVKRAFQRLSTEWLDRPEWPEPKRNPEFCLNLVTRKVVVPSAAEIEVNPRSRSARLRVAERPSSP